MKGCREAPGLGRVAGVSVREAAQQREPSVAPGNYVHGTWHEADIGSSGSTEASMTGFERGAVIKRGGTPVDPPTRGRMSAA